MTAELPRDQIAQTDRFNFVDFARDPAYRAANRELLRQAFSRLPNPFVHIDIASGTGLVAQEISGLCGETGKRGTVIGIDPDAYAVRSARATTPSTPSCQVEFLEGRAQDLKALLAGKIPTGGADYVTIHDALHEMEEEDKTSILRSVAGVLKPGGLFTYNSAFTTAAMDQAAMQWGRWKSRAFALLNGKRNRRVTGLVTHSPAEYVEMISAAGLSVVHEARKPVRMSRSALEGIARYPRFVWGMFADFIGQESIPIEVKSQALLQALHELGMNDIPRVWHEALACKPVSSGEARA